MKSNVKWWLLVTMMLVFVLGPRMIFAQGAEDNAQHVSERSETPLTIEFTRIYPVPEAFHESITKALEKERSFLPNVDEWTVSAFRSTEEWAQIILVPTYIVEGDWKKAPTDDEIVEVVAYLSDGKWDAYLIHGDLFTNIKSKIPRSFIDYSQISTPLPYLFSWTSGQSWYKTQGWHQGNAIDFAPDRSDPSVDYAVLAANSGTLSEVCNDGYQSILKIEHSEGSTQYWHLDSATTRIDLLGQNIPRGQFLGQLYNGTAHVDGICDPNDYNFPLRYNTKCGCGKNPHLHFVLPDKNIEIDGHNANDVANAPQYTQYLSSNKRVDNPDTDPPTTTASFSDSLGNNGWYRSDVEVTLTADEPTNWIRYRINGGSWKTYTNPFVIENDGHYTLEYYAEDTSGNTEEPKVASPFKIDSNAPSLTDFSINNDASTSNNLTVLLTNRASDAMSGLAEMCVSYNQLNWECDDYKESTFLALPLRELEDIQVYFYVTDLAGNESNIRSATIRLDFYPPIPHSASYRMCKNVMNAAGQHDLKSDSYALTSAFGEAVASTNPSSPSSPSSDSYRLISGFLADVEGCLPIERTFGYSLIQSVIASGGNSRKSTSYRVDDTLGQPIVSSSSSQFSMQSPSYRLTSGFWANVPLNATSRSNSVFNEMLYLPIIRR